MTDNLENQPFLTFEILKLVPNPFFILILFFTDRTLSQPLCQRKNAMGTKLPNVKQ